MKFSRNSLTQSFFSRTKIVIVTLLFILISVFIIFAKIDDNLTVNSFRSKSTNIVYLISSTIISPLKIISDGFERILDIRNLYTELQKYKSEQIIEAVSFQELVALKLKIAKYEELLNIETEQDYGYMTARIVADLSKKYFSSILINLGKSNGIFVNMSITGQNGLIGRVSDVDSKISRGLLLTDISSRVPVLISDKGYQGILIGQNIKNPKIEFIEDIQNVSIGDLVTTSAKGGIFPPYIFVGQVIKKNEKSVEVELFENVDRLTHIRLLKYNSYISTTNDF